jgi:acyl-coenzyme A thioesterase PaaI-like protein
VKEQIGPRAFRWLMNLWPCYRGTGGRVTYIAPDWKEIRVRLPLGLQTRNYVGSIFGGSLYAAVDPPYMLMLIRLLGPAYVVWDKAATIRFLKPGRTTLYATCRVDDAELEEIRRLLQTESKIDRTYPIALADAQGTVHAEVEKVIRIRRKDPGGGAGRAA